MIAKYKRKSNIAAAVCGVALILALLSIFINEGNIWVSSQDIAQFCALIGGIAFYFALWAYIKSKGRSGFWVLLAVFLSLIGLIIIYFLKDKSKDIKTDLVDEN